jgi:hypothetical protein
MSKHDDRHALKAAPDRHTCEFNFPAFMDQIRPRVTAAAVDAAGEILRALIVLIETATRDSQPLPIGLKRLFAVVRQELARLTALHARLRETVVGPPDTAAAARISPASVTDGSTAASAGGTMCQFDPTVEALMTLNYWYLAGTVSREMVDAALAALFDRLKRKPIIGRPSRQIARIREAKRMRDEERLTWGQIAHRLEFIDAKRARLAVKHHFPNCQVEVKAR